MYDLLLIYLYILHRIGSLDTSIFLDLSRYLTKETDFVPLATSIPHLTYIISTVDDSSSQTIGKVHIQLVINNFCIINIL